VHLITWQKTKKVAEALPQEWNSSTLEFIGLTFEILRYGEVTMKHGVVMLAVVSVFLVSSTVSALTWYGNSNNTKGGLVFLHPGEDPGILYFTLDGTFSWTDKQKGVSGMTDFLASLTSGMWLDLKDFHRFDMHVGDRDGLLFQMGWCDNDIKDSEVPDPSNDQGGGFTEEPVGGNNPVPEPATLLLMGVGLLTVVCYRRKKKA
jgi:hypothetical protein